jgi:thymidylate synthase
MMTNWLDMDYQKLLSEIVQNGKIKGDRTGTGTKSIFGKQIRHDMRSGFPLLTTKRMAWNAIVTELLWFLKGDTNIKYLVDNGCNIWNGDAYKRYRTVYEIESRENTGPYYSNSLADLHMLEDLSMEQFVERIINDDAFAEKWGELGPIYGNQWREWGSRYETNYILGETKRVRPGVDQIAKLIYDLKTNPDSRRLMVNAWNVEELDNMVLPPCHYGFQVYTTEMGLQERRSRWAESIGHNEHYAANLDHEDLDERDFPRRKISLMWNQRSVDTFLGLPFNIASYGLLLTIIGKAVNMVPDELIGSLGDTHLYLNHLSQASQQIRREPFDLPYVTVDMPISGKIEDLTHDHIRLFEYQCHEQIKAPLSN